MLDGRQIAGCSGCRPCLALAVRPAAPDCNGEARGGFEATAAMRDLVLGGVLTCELDGEATYDRRAAICYLDGTDIYEEMIRLGLARDCPRFSGGRYKQAEREAAE
jgi:endonuclease YncB( thermonuclease family)